LIIHASGNGRLVRLLAALRSQVSIFQILDAEYPTRLELAMDGHVLIIQALIDGKPDLAASLLADHIAIARDGVLSDMFDKSNVMTTQETLNAARERHSPLGADSHE